MNDCPFCDIPESDVRRDNFYAVAVVHGRGGRIILRRHDSFTDCSADTFTWTSWLAWNVAQTLCDKGHTVRIVADMQNAHAYIDVEVTDG